MEEYRLKIQKLDHFERGISRLGDKPVFIPWTIIDEEVLITIKSEKKKFFEGELIRVIKKSPYREKTRCPYYMSCGGCQGMHLQYEKQLEFKVNKVKEIFKKFANIELDKLNIISSPQFNYRNKVVFNVYDNKLSFYKEKSNDSINISECLLLDEEINRIIFYLNEYLSKNKPFNKVTIRVNNNKEIALNIEGPLELKELEKHIDKFKVISIINNNKCVYGLEYSQMYIFDKKFNLSIDSFFQVNKYQIENLYKSTLEFVKKNKFNKVLDLYSGTGTIGIIVSPYVKSVIGIEENPSSVKDAKINKTMNDSSNINFYLSSVEEKLEEIKDVDLVIVDPPRSGLKSKVVKALLENKPKYINYISCDPVTLVRDINELKDSYDIISIELVDMFPNTYHVETVVLMSRENH